MRSGERISPQQRGFGRVRTRSQDLQNQYSECSLAEKTVNRSDERIEARRGSPIATAQARQRRNRPFLDPKPPAFKAIHELRTRNPERPRGGRQVALRTLHGAF